MMDNTSALEVAALEEDCSMEPESAVLGAASKLLKTEQAEKIERQLYGSKKRIHRELWEKDRKKRKNNKKARRRNR